MHRGYLRAVIALSFSFALPSSFEPRFGASIARVEVPGCWIAAAAAAGCLWSIDFLFLYLALTSDAQGSIHLAFRISPLLRFSMAKTNLFTAFSLAAVH